MPIPQMTLDLPGMFLAAQNLRRQKEAQAFQQQQAALNYRLQQDQAAKLEQYRAAQMQQDQAALAQKQAESEADRAAKAEAEAAKANANRQWMAAQRLKSDPKVRVEDVIAPLAAAKALPQGFDDAIAQYGAMGEQGIPGLAKFLEDSAAGVLGVPKPEDVAKEREQYTTDARNFMSATGARPDANGMIPGFKEWLKANRASGGVNINVGGSGKQIGQKTNDEIESDLKGLNVIAGELDAVERDMASLGGPEAIFGLGNRGADWWLKTRASLSPEWANKSEIEWKRGRDKVLQRLASLKIAYKKTTMGAAMNEAEEAMLMEAIPTAKDDPLSATNKISGWRDRVASESNVLNQMRTGGLDSNGSPAASVNVNVPDLSKMSEEEMQVWAAGGK